MSGSFLIWILPCLTCLGWLIVRGRGGGATSAVESAAALCVFAGLALSFPPLHQWVSYTHNTSLLERAQPFVGRSVAELEHELGTLDHVWPSGPDGSSVAELNATPWYAPIGDCRVLIGVSAEQQVFMVSLDD
ncbi:hypothetical protein [Hyphococcus sp.]|uniref:hypothetical protein n=1 Tax=Hyphococcus sp. TaxID=2038636 RepID=UPI00208A4DBD|nr:MAG: hypothetical protein DHS20C04_31830 [Marinicaulis sp.]